MKTRFLTCGLLLLLPLALAACNRHETDDTVQPGAGAAMPATTPPPANPAMPPATMPPPASTTMPPPSMPATSGTAGSP